MTISHIYSRGKRCNDEVDLFGRIYDRWILSVGLEHSHQYLLHLGSPRFVSKIARHLDHRQTGGLSFLQDETLFFDIIFFDEAPASTHDMNELFRAAVRALAAFPQNIDPRPGEEAKR